MMPFALATRVFKQIEFLGHYGVSLKLALANYSACYQRSGLARLSMWLQRQQAQTALDRNVGACLGLRNCQSEERGYAQKFQQLS